MELVSTNLLKPQLEFLEDQSISLKEMKPNFFMPSSSTDLSQLLMKLLMDSRPIPLESIPQAYAKTLLMMSITLSLLSDLDIRMDLITGLLRTHGAEPGEIKVSSRSREV